MIPSFSLYENMYGSEGFDKVDWQPENLRICPRGEWNDRMLIETVLSMLTLVCGFKKVMHRVWAYFKTRVGLTMALFNILVSWHGLPIGTVASTVKHMT